MKRSLILGSIILLVPSLVIAEAGVFLHEDFNDLKNWRSLYFPNIERHTLYSIVTEGCEKYLRAESHASASGLIFAGRFNVYEYPKMRWRWKVDHVYRHGDVHTKTGDDYPMRLYVIFQNDSRQEGPMEFLAHSIGFMLSLE